MPELTATGRVILGMVALGKTTGYDIKQLVDKSTRHFWAASYGQIYPELRRLEADGLIRGRSEPSGARARTTYELTEAGQLALRDWMEDEGPLAWELRDEGLLKLFFSDLFSPERKLAIVSQMRKSLEAKREQLAALDPSIPVSLSGPRLTLEYGRAMTDWMLDWCRSTERHLAEEPAA